MCEALRELMKDEIEREIEEQKQQAVLETERKISIELVKNLMDSMKWTAEQAMEAMKVPVKDREQYMAGL